MKISVAVGPEILPFLKEQAQQILNEAHKQGATAAEVSVSVEQGFSARVRQGSLEAIEFNKDQSVGITVYRGIRKGSASTSDHSLASLRQTISGALAIAQATSEDPCAGLAAAELMAKKVEDLDLYHPWDITPEEAVALALGCEAAAFSHDPQIHQAEETALHTYTGCRVYGNSHGFIEGALGTRHSLSCAMIAREDQCMQQGHWYDLARKHTDLARAEDIGRRAAEQTIARLNARSVPTGSAPVLFSAELATGLWGHFLAAVSGGALYRKASFLQEALGEQIFPEWISLEEHPHLPGGLASTYFDGDGLATYNKYFVQNGLVSSYILGTYAGRKLNLPSTANAGGVHNLLVNHSNQDQAELLRTMQRGLYVTELMGQSVNLVTGDYSRGAAGFWVEHGEIQYPVQEVTIAGNLREMFRKIVAVGNDYEWRSRIRSGSVLIERMMIAGTQ